MGKSLNNNSVQSAKGHKIAARDKEIRNSIKAGFAPNQEEIKEQVINARKGANLDLAKAKAKKKAKMIKASKKKNKK